MIIKIKIYFILLSIISISCLDDNLIPIDKIELNQTAEILRYLESIGDYPNTELAPALVSASELFSNSSHYYILDIREPAEYLVGHINGAVNISTSNLYETVDSFYTINPVKNIAIVSQNGQASSYFACLLRLAGYNNVHTLNYGMASWNIDFANEWFAALGNNDQTFSNTEYPSNAFTHLPNLEFPSSVGNAKEMTEYRIKEIINKGFLKDLNYLEEISIENTIDLFLVCYGEGKLYNAPRDLGSLGHPENTVWFQYSPLFEFRSVNSLQTLPNDQPILIYSGDGQLSACIAAYLTVLGYDAKTLLFGANQLFYFRLSTDPSLTKYAFSNEDIMNYPYITGNQ
jgi:rhodanese-related sulfurtransferase